MLKSLKARFILIALVLVGCLWTIFDRGITLGLDLRGGTHLALEVNDPVGALSDAQRADAVDRALRVIRTRVDELGVAEPTVQKVGQYRIVVQLPGASQEEQQRAKDVIQQAAFLQFQIVRPAQELQGNLARIDRAVATSVGATADAAGEQAPAGGIGGLFESAEDSAAATADTAVAARPFS